MPGAAVLLYEGFRYETLEHVLPGVPAEVGNVMVAVLVLLLTYAFVGSQLFRIAQEALANVARHSGATRVEVDLTYNAGAVTMRVADDGRGFEPAKDRADGFGLRSMSERLAKLGGSVEIESVPGEGTRVICVCPLDGESEKEGNKP